MYPSIGNIEQFFRIFICYFYNFLGGDPFVFPDGFCYVGKIQGGISFSPVGFGSQIGTRAFDS